MKPRFVRELRLRIKVFEYLSFSHNGINMRKKIIPIIVAAVLLIAAIAAYLLVPLPLQSARDLTYRGEMWSAFNPGVVDATVTGDTLTLTLKRRALWAGNGQGALVSKTVTGNFKATAIVRAHKASNPTQTVASPVSLGGLAARNPAGADAGLTENYVHIVVGNTPAGIGIETKTTLNGATSYEAIPGPMGDAELRICRVGAQFYLYQRPIGTPQWVLAKAHARPDLPDTLMVGATIYAALPPDLQVSYENLRIQPGVQAQADCESD